MQNLHVESLEYILETNSTLRFNNPPSIMGEEDSFKYELADAKLNVTMTTHFPSEDSARAVVDDFLRAWELSHALCDGGDKRFWFTFKTAKVVDRTPQILGQHVLLAGSGSIKCTATVNANMTVVKSSYPVAPSKAV